ncbi:hypothetical protein BZG36_01072 [Bifiguratus adelaidae]|uniref:Uncharacterized protein n=1 Tax=Bifiguratus adelaidae TaxID=1938954 RepID=A0A261Y6A0_9FUNG|nr:hypothetical protein BZG36_01072 [Bifiguratus adelaidae]
MWQELGLLATLLLLPLVIYWARTAPIDTGDHGQRDVSSAATTKNKKRKKKAKKSTTVASQDTDALAAVQGQQDAAVVKDAPKQETKPVLTKASADITKKPSPPPSPSPADQPSIPSFEEAAKDRRPDIDALFEPPTYSRVMRIAPEQPKAVRQQVPAQAGWQGVDYSRPTSSSPKAAPEPLTKKQRQNQLRAQRKKEEKQSFAEQQAARLRHHKKDLEARRLDELTRKPAPNPSSFWDKKPASASVVDGRLIWE